MNIIKRTLPILIAVVMLVMLSACGSSEPCKSCGKTPTKAYTNEYSGDKEYYCSDCSSECAFCSDEASEYYTSGLGSIVFVCDDCYQEIMDLNS